MTATETESTTGLVADILGDAQKLAEQHLKLLQHEFRSDLRRTGELAAFGAVGMVSAQLACVAMLAGVIGWLAWAVPAWPWWAWSLLAGVVLSAAAAAVLAWTYHQANSFNPLPDETAAKTQESLRWLANRI